MESVPPPIIGAPEKQRGAWKLPVLLAWSFGYSLVSSLVLFAFQVPLRTSRAQPAWVNGVVAAFELVSLGFLALLVRDDKGWWRRIKFGLKWSDPFVGIGLAIICLLAMNPWRILLPYLPHDSMQPTAADWSRSRYFSAGWTPSLLLFITVNPFFEELIARAFFMTELKRFSWPGWLIILASAGFQASYHLYQGWQSASLVFITFLCLSIYFARTGRIMPVILAHLVLDYYAAWYTIGFGGQIR